MAGRAHRRLLGAGGLADTLAEDEASSSDEEEVAQSTPFNPFSLLTDEEDGVSGRQGPSTAWPPSP